MNNAKQILTESSCLFFLLGAGMNSAGGRRPVFPSLSLERRSVTPSPRCIFYPHSSTSSPSVAHQPPTPASHLRKTPRRLSAAPFIISAPSRPSVLGVVSRQIVSPFCHHSSLPVCVTCLVVFLVFHRCFFSCVFQCFFFLKVLSICGGHSTSDITPSCCCLPGSSPPGSTWCHVPCAF